VSDQPTSSRASRQGAKPARRKRRKKRGRKSRSSIGSFPLAFGMYAGKPISSIPTSYLKWALDARGVSAADKWVLQQFLNGQKGRRS